MIPKLSAGFSAQFFSLLRFQYGEEFSLNNAYAVAEGFGAGLIVYAFVWGMTLPIRWFFKQIGIGR